MPDHAEALAEALRPFAGRDKKIVQSGGDSVNFVQISVLISQLAAATAALAAYDAAKKAKPKPEVERPIKGHYGVIR